MIDDDHDYRHIKEDFQNEEIIDTVYSIDHVYGDRLYQKGRANY